MIRRRIAAWIIIACVVVALGACAHEPPPAKVSDITSPPAEWLAPAEPLPDVPACRLPSLRARIACRADYDTATRAAYVALAERHKGLAGWVATVQSRRVAG